MNYNKCNKFAIFHWKFNEPLETLSFENVNKIEFRLINMYRLI